MRKACGRFSPGRISRPRRCTAFVTSKKDVIGSSCPKHLCDESRDEFTATPAELGALVAAVNTEFERLLRAMDEAGVALGKALRKVVRKTLKAKPKGR